MSRKIRVALCLPWYQGAHRDVTAQMLTMFNYFGRLQERLSFLARGASLDHLPPLDPYDATKGAEVTPDLVGTEIEFAIADQMACSLVGLARERCVDVALGWGADYCFFFDSDMHIPTSAFLTLLRDDKPIVAALAFTGRDPITPVIYKAEEVYEEDPERKGEGLIHFDYSAVLHYEKDALQQVDAIGGGVMLIKSEVFRKIKKPWFYTVGVGEDIYFCLRAKREGIPVFVDTRVKSPHVMTHAGWQTEQKWLERAARENL